MAAAHKAAADFFRRLLSVANPRPSPPPAASRPPSASRRGPPARRSVQVEDPQAVPALAEVAVEEEHVHRLRGDAHETALADPVLDAGQGEIFVAGEDPLVERQVVR